MTNCLKTQLKDTIDNSNLLKLGEKIFGFTRKNSSTIDIRTNTAVIVKTLDGTFSDSSTEKTVVDSAILNYVDTSRFSFCPIYRIWRFVLESTTPTTISIGDLKLMPLQHVKLRTDESFTVQDTYAWEQLEYCQFVNCPNLTGSTADFANHPAKDKLNNILITESKITGTLDDFLSLSALTALNIRYCNIEVKRSTLNTLEARGVTVTYSQTPIEDV